MGIEEGLSESGTSQEVCLEYQWGRPRTCDETPVASVTNGTFPNPTMGMESMFSYFADEFGLSVPEVTALLGAHSLGSASKKNSGYDGPWNPINSHSFSNVYYKMMVDPTLNWKQVVNMILPLYNAQQPSIELSFLKFYFPVGRV